MEWGQREGGWSRGASSLCELHARQGGGWIRPGAGLNQTRLRRVMDHEYDEIRYMTDACTLLRSQPRHENFFFAPRHCL